MGSVDKELVTKLQDAGQRLSLLPTDVNELLPLLDYVEDLLARVEQSPPEIIQKAYAPSMKALLEEPLLRHSNVDVKVAIASCISEITRITAPEAPYNDEQMKDVFELIVSSFEDLADKNSRSYNKRASILETLAKVRSCVVMLDLECDSLIVEMFQHFLRSIRDYHSQNVFTSMETIMTLVLDESEDISMELLEPILTNLKEEKEEIPTIARKLGEKVFENCADKIKPYLAQAVKFLGVPLEDYSKVVSSICDERTDAVENNAVNVSGELAEEKKLPSSDGAGQVDDSKLLTASSDEKIQKSFDKEVKEQVMEEAVPKEVHLEAERSAQSVMSNGITETENEGISVLPESLKKPDGSDFSSQPLDVNATNKMDTDDLDTAKSVEHESKAEETDKIKGKDSNSAIHSTETSDPSHVDEKKEVKTCLKMSEEAADKSPCPQKSSNQNVNTGDFSETEKELVAKNSSVEGLDNEVGAIASPSPSESVPDKSLPNKTDEPKKEDGQEDAPSIEPVSPKIADGTGDSEAKSLKSSGENKENSHQDDAPNVDLVHEKGTDVTSDSEVKALTRSAKKKENLPQEVAPSEDPASAKVADRTSDSEVKTKRRSGKKNKGLVEPSAETVKTVDASSNFPVRAPRSLRKQKENRAREDPPSADPTPPLRVADAINDSNIKRQKRSGTKTTARITKDENMVAGGGVSKTAGDDTTSDSEAKSLTQKAKKEASDLGGKAVKKTGKQGETSDLEEKTVKKSGKQGETSDSEEKAVKKLVKLGETSDSEEKSVKKSGKQGETSRTKGKSLKHSAGKKGDVNDSETKTSKKASKKDDASNKYTVSSKKGDVKKPGCGKDSSERDLVKDSVNDGDQEMVSSPKSTTKSVKEDDHVGDPKTISKRKRTTPGKEKGMPSSSEKASGNVEYGENLVGSKIKVWWPKDKAFYEGEVASFDPQKKKHKVSYTDGDEEILCLQRQRWEFIDDKTEEPEEDEDSNHESAKMHKKTKAKTNHDQSAKQHDVSPKRAGASSSKGKRKATKNLAKSDGESDEELLKPIKRSKGDDGGKSKTTEKSKEETPKPGIKTKSKSPTTGIKANGSGKGKSSLPKEKETEAKKGKSSEPSRTPDTSKGRASETKSGKKRRRESRG